ncbi:hypothetical protein D3C81_443350 [compost metagenome]
MLISNKYIAGNIRNEDDLCQASESKFDAGCFNKCTILDSSGEKYNIISSTKKNLYELNIVHFLKLFFINMGGHYLSFSNDKTIWVTFNLSSPEKKNLDEIKKELTDLFLKNPKWFKNSDFSQAQAIELFINEARTVKELIENISVWS